MRVRIVRRIAPFGRGHPFYVIVNLEVGGSWAGAPNASSFPMTMLVDYVRVYKAAM